MNTNVYENLYNNMKNAFTVVNDNHEYTLGEYMLMKAGKKKAERPNLPALRNTNNSGSAIVSFFNYINDKLAVKAPPVKDKTIRAFPIRTALTAMLSALVVSTLVITYATATMRTVSTANVSSIVELTQNETEEEVNFDTLG